MPIEFIPATCPKCGGELRVPDNLKTAKCMYCGVDFLVNNSVIENEIIIQNYKDIADFSSSNQNYQEAYDYYSKILELDCKNPFGLLGKGFTHGNLILSEVVTEYSEWENQIRKIEIPWKYFLTALIGNSISDQMTSPFTFFESIISKSDGHIRLLAAKYCLELGRIKTSLNNKLKYLLFQETGWGPTYDAVKFIKNLVSAYSVFQIYEGLQRLYLGRAYSLLKNGERINISPNGIEVDKEEIISQFIIPNIINSMNFHKEHYEKYLSDHNRGEWSWKSLEVDQTLSGYDRHSLTLQLQRLMDNTTLKDNALINEIILKYESYGIISTIVENNVYN